jgi:hypothetical protein
MSTPPGPIISVRSALILAISFIVGIAAGVLTFVGGEPWSAAVLAGGAATATSVVLFNSVIEK